MSERKTDTIRLGNFDYAKVSARSAELHKDNETCGIETSCEFKDGHVLFSAKVTTKKGTFTGHSLGKVGGQQKQFEKQETIAVGRALAFAGYLATGEIASYEEMADVVTTAQLGSLKLKFSQAHAHELTGLDRPAKLQKFNSWARKVTGEDADFTDESHWTRDWYDACCRALAADVPFEE